MGRQYDGKLYQVAEEVLERLAFILSFPEEGMQPIDKTTAVGAKVSFSGPFEGKVIMLISGEVLPELAGNMLGIDDPDETTTEQRHDALCELINVVCGNLLPEIGGKTAVFNVNPPVIISPAEEAKATKADPVSVVQLPLEEGQCDLLLYLEEEA